MIFYKLTKFSTFFFALMNCLTRFFLSFCETVVPFWSARIESRTSLSFSICFGRRKFFIPDLILFAISLFIKSPVDNKFKIISAHTETLRNYDLLAILPPQMPICGRWKEWKFHYTERMVYSDEKKFGLPSQSCIRCYITKFPFSAPFIPFRVSFFG